MVLRSTTVLRKTKKKDFCILFLKVCGVHIYIWKKAKVLISFRRTDVVFPMNEMNNFFLFLIS